MTIPKPITNDADSEIILELRDIVKPGKISAQEAYYAGMNAEPDAQIFAAPSVEVNGAEIRASGLGAQRTVEEAETAASEESGSELTFLQAASMAGAGGGFKTTLESFDGAVQPTLHEELQGKVPQEKLEGEMPQGETLHGKVLQEKVQDEPAHEQKGESAAEHEPYSEKSLVSEQPQASSLGTEYAVQGAVSPVLPDSVEVRLPNENPVPAAAPEQRSEVDFDALDAELDKILSISSSTSSSDAAPAQDAFAESFADIDNRLEKLEGATDILGSRIDALPSMSEMQRRVSENVSDMFSQEIASARAAMDKTTVTYAEMEKLVKQQSATIEALRGRLSVQAKDLRLLQEKVAAMEEGMEQKVAAAAASVIREELAIVLQSFSKK